MRKKIIFGIVCLALVGVPLGLGVVLWTKIKARTSRRVSGPRADAPLDPVPKGAPVQAFPDVSFQGFLEKQVKLTDVEFGRGLTFPIYFTFTTRPGVASPVLGVGWECAFFDASAVLLSPRVLQASMLNGMRLILFQDKSDKNVFESIDGGWFCHVDKKNYTLSNQGGWSFEYVNGKIARVKNDIGRVLEWVRNPDQSLSEIREEGVDPVVQVGSAGSDGTIGLTINGNTYLLEMGNAPYSLAGTETEKSLSRIVLPGGKSEGFTCLAANSSNAPTLVLSEDANEVDRFTWDPKTRFIESSRDWDYQVTPPDLTDLKVAGRTVRQSNPLVKVAALEWARAAIQRKRRDTGAIEMESVDVNSGISVREVADGTKFVSYRIMSKGPLFNKLRKIERISGGATNVIMQCDYNEMGKLVRQKSETDGETVFAYTPAGKILSAVQNGKLILQAQYDASGRVVSFYDGTSTNGFTFTYHVLGGVTVQYTNFEGKLFAEEMTTKEVEAMFDKKL